MNEDIVKNAVLYILERAENQEISIGKTRLIKLLYLLDIEHYRLNQIVLTEMDWIFYKYGPYSFEIDDFLEKIGVTEEDIHISEGKTFTKLRKEFGEDDIKIAIEIKAVIEKLIKDWGTADLNELLDYIYFETEPMRIVKFKKKLDFLGVKGKREELEIELSRESKEKLVELGKRIKEHLEKTELPDDAFVKLPAEFKEKPYFWKDEVEDLSKLKGKVKVKDA